MLRTWRGYGPIRHRDHIVEHQAGGPTTADNGAGLCEACNTQGYPCLCEQVRLQYRSGLSCQPPVRRPP
ncbi:HNH endonuclease [Antrihabitans cavernicola]|uniref:HNH endonuclease n=1 Tax=Antrihabitans cavernicola TaxID=2495913 RepID=A0A5A7S6Z3_9NOCA|nr:HNH endonuclease [Spelaeibacter cavernicola]